MADGRLRLLTVSLACVGNEADLELCPVASSVTAGGGSSKASWSEARWEPSRPFMSVDDAGVGNEVVRGILIGWDESIPGRNSISGESNQSEGRNATG